MSIRETAEELNISPHTLKNWIRRENLNPRAVSRLNRGEKLTRMANKKHSTRRHIPVEMIGNRKNIVSVEKVVGALEAAASDTEERLFLFLLIFLCRKGFIPLPETDREGLTGAEFLACASPLPVLHSELRGYAREMGISLNTPYPPSLLKRGFLSKLLLNEPDLPGIIYQALRMEGNRIQAGAYYTPRGIIRNLLKSAGAGKAAFLMDPCCGSGLFLCEFARSAGRPDTVRGMDRDRNAVLLARINLFLLYPGIESLEAIAHGDALSPASWNLPEGCVIATNPPWGAHFTAEEKKRLKRTCQIHSGESFSCFISRAMKELPHRGKGAFLLPEAALYVKAHSDLRRIILEETTLREVITYGPLFRGVYTDVIQLTLEKSPPGSRRRTRVALKKNPDHPIQERQKTARFRRNPHQIINIHCTGRDREILSRLEEGKITSPPPCRWLLGTVTGDNRRFLTETPEEETIPVLTGKEIQSFRTLPPRLYLRTDRGTWQQFRSPREYREAKIVYTFIGSRPSFAVDHSGLMTLNSANCMIPPGPDLLYPLTGWYNSELFRFMWWKEFRSLKLLRSQLEYLPLPDWSESLKQDLSSLVKKGEKGEDIKLELNRILYDFFDISRKEQEYVRSEI